MPVGSMRVEHEGPETVRQAVREFLESYPAAVVMEAGERLFDLREASYELSDEGRRVVLHLWSADRNMVRRLVSATRQGSVLRMEVLRLGQKTPTRMELVAGDGREMPMGRDRARARYAAVLTRVLEREFGEWEVESARSTMDLQHSFGPAFVRGVQVRGQQGWAFVGIGAAEGAAVVEGILSVGMLWMVHLRERAGVRRVIGGLRLIVPEGQGALTQARLAWMDGRIAAYELYELQERTGELRRCDPEDRGNVRTKLLRAPDETVALQADGRFAAALPAALGVLPQLPDGEVAWARGARLRDQLTGVGVEVRLRSGAELAFLRYGLEFCRIRLGFGGESFNRVPEVVVGSGLQETVLTEANADELRWLVGDLFARRCALSGKRRLGQIDAVPAETDVLYRTQPERWLESRLRAEVQVLDESLCAEPVYVQIGAVVGSRDRGVVDLLARTRAGRLAVIEVKTDEDLHLALQGLDYWIRVREHHRAHVDPATGMGDLQQQGYFAGTRLSAEAPLLLLVAPALHIHPSTEVVLRHLHPGVEWRLIALDERWRVRLKPIWTRRSDGRRVSA